MDAIKSTNNLKSISVYDLNTKFNDRCYVDWSKSNLISIVTLDGIYILRLQLDKQHGPFQFELIRNPTSRFRHLATCNLGPTFDTIWQTLDSHQYMEVFLDPALLTNVPILNLDLYPRRFRIAKWSPLIDWFPRQCLLATITVDYQLLIYSSKFNQTWTILADLSSEYDKLWAQLQIGSKDLNTKDNFECIRKNLHSLSFCNVCWKETNKHGPILLATTIPGDIVIWQINLPDNMIDSPNNLLQCDIKMILRTNLEYISSMQLFENLLIVSARNGQVVLYDLTVNFNETEDTHSGSKQQMNGATAVKTLNVITLPPTVTLWHQDGIEVTDFFIQTLSEDTFRIVLSKSTNICWSNINYTKQTDNEPATLGISDSFSAIDGRDPEVSLHQTPATWLRPAGDKKSVLIADDGSFFQLEFLDDRQDTSPEFNAIGTGRIDLSRMVPRGLSTSPGGHLITMISCITLMYEPAKILAPSKLILIPSENEGSFFDDCLQKLLDENWLLSNKTTSPMDVCDRIDYLRSTFPLLSKKQCSKLSNRLKESLPEVLNDEVQFVKFKIAAFLLMKLLDQRRNDKQVENETERMELDQKITYMILIHSIEQILTLISDEQSPNYYQRRLYDLDQVNSLRNYFKYLGDLPAGRKLIDQHKDKYHDLELKYADVPQESCPICRSDIPYVSIKDGTCSNGHRFDRCARSLLVMDLKANDELVCENCKRHYMIHMVWPTKNLWLCSFCQ